MTRSSPSSTIVDSEASKAAAREALARRLATPHIDIAFIEGEQRESKERRLTPEYVERVLRAKPFSTSAGRSPGAVTVTGDWTAYPLTSGER